MPGSISFPLRSGPNRLGNPRGRLRSGGKAAILKGNYHLIYTWETGRLRLYDTANDIGEQNDIAANNPEVVKALATELSQYLRERDAQRPSFKSTGKLCPWPDETL